jgi:hypothetical protein
MFDCHYYLNAVYSITFEWHLLKTSKLSYGGQARILFILIYLANRGIFTNNVSKFSHLLQKTHRFSAINFGSLIMLIDDCCVSWQSPERVSEMYGHRAECLCVNPLTPELNPSPQCYQMKYFTVDFGSWIVHFFNVCVKNKQMQKLFIQFINYIW